MKQIAIIGATGRNASAWTLDFLKAGYSVRALAREATRRPPLDGIVWTEFDLNAPGTYLRALEGVDLFALITPAEPGQTERELALIELAKDAGVARILNVSVYGADLPSPISAFARWQAPVEAALRVSGLAYVTLRPNAYMQSILLQREAILAGRYIEPSGEAATSLIDVGDISAVAVAVARGEHDGEAIDLTGPRALTGREIAAALTEATRAPVSFVSPSPSQFRQALLERGAPLWRANAVGELYEAVQAGRAPHLAKVSPATLQLLGRNGRSLAEFLIPEFRAR